MSLQSFLYGFEDEITITASGVSKVRKMKVGSLKVVWCQLWPDINFIICPIAAWVWSGQETGGTKRRNQKEMRNIDDFLKLC